MKQEDVDKRYQVYKEGYKDIEGVPQRYEAYLGKPGTSGWILTSDTVGKRAWINPTLSGAMIYPGTGIPVSNGLTGWATSITPATGLLRYSGSVFSWDNNTYLTAIPIASNSVLGGVKINGGGLSIDPVTGLLSATGAAATITVANEASDVENFVAFFTTATGNLEPKTNGSFKFNAATGELTVTSIHATGNIWSDGEIAAHTGADPGSDFWNSVPHATKDAYGTIRLEPSADVSKIFAGNGTWIAATTVGTTVHSSLTNLDYASSGHTGFLAATLKGAANGLAELDAYGWVKNTQLPSYVDDVLEYANFAALPVTGETGKIYVTIDTNLTYRWSGSVYTEISASLALGETSGTAYRGDRGKTAYDYSQIGHLPLSGGTLTGHLLFSTDNTKDIGATGATRPRTGYFGTSVATPSIVTTSGALGITPYAGSNLNITLSTTGDLAVNTNQLYVDTSSGKVGFGTAAPDEIGHIVGNLHVTGNIYSGGEIQAFTDTPPSSDYWLNVPHATASAYGTVKIGTGLHIDGSGFLVSDAGAGVTDGDKGDIVVSASGATWMIDSGVRANWDTAYTDRNKWDGGTSGLVASTGRASLGLGNSATRDVGTTTGTVLEGRTFGTAANNNTGDFATAAQGTDARTPISHNNTYHSETYITSAALSPYAPLASPTFTGNIGLNGYITLEDSCYFLGSPTYGFRFNDHTSTYNNFIIYENGNTYTRGNVGIGTTAPSNKLTIGTDADNDSYNFPLYLQGYALLSGAHGYGSYGGIILGANNGFTSSAKRYLITNALNTSSFAIIRSTNATTSPTLGDSGVITSGTADFVITNTGLIGIGTTTPQKKLVVSNGGALGFEIDPTSTSGTQTDILSYNRSTSAYKPMYFQASEFWFNDKVGIGTTSPARHLQVGADTTAASVYVRTNSANANENGFIWANGGTDKWFLYRPGSSNDLRLYDGADRVTFQAGGNVGIANSAPSGLFQVGGGSFGTSHVSYNDSHFGPITIMGHKTGGDCYLAGNIQYTNNWVNKITGTKGTLLEFSDGAYNFYTGTGTTAGSNATITLRMSLNNTGDLSLPTGTVTATNFSATSDRRLKDFIATITGDTISAQAKKFELKSAPGKLRYGYIAQEVAVTHPELVNIDSNGNLSLNYIDLLVHEIASLKTRLHNMERRMSNGTT